jgi:hypothetical protein
MGLGYKGLSFEKKQEEWAWGKRDSVSEVVLSFQAASLSSGIW